MFSPLFVDNTDINDMYLMIDPQRFTIIPAVPQVPHHRSQKSLENTRQTNILFPVTAVPDSRPNPSSSVSRNPNKNLINNLDKKPATRPPPVVSDNNIPSTTTEERKKFRRCHGRCVQKFCLPVGSLSEHAECQDSCKDICSVWLGLISDQASFVSSPDRPDIKHQIAAPVMDYSSLTNNTVIILISHIMLQIRMS